VADWLKKPGQIAEKKARQQHEARMRAEAIENARRYCDTCKSELTRPDASYCPKCGGSRISSGSQIREREAAQDQDKRRKKREEESRVRAAKLREEQERQKQERAKLREAAARKKCREIAVWQFCARCRCERETTDRFCIKCAAALELIPPSFAFDLAKKELPDLVRTKEDFNRFVNGSQRLR
jgi:hypothetical protein